MVNLHPFGFRAEEGKGNKVVGHNLRLAKIPLYRYPPVGLERVGERMNDLLGLDVSDFSVGGCFVVEAGDLFPDAHTLVG